MAIFVPGMPCPLCGMPVGRADEVIAFPPFIADRSDPLFLFSDAAMHATCFTQHRLAKEATEWHAEVRRRGLVSNSVCAACGNRILDPDDYFGTGLLARDPSNPLHEFNFVHLHRSHAGTWNRFDEFRRRMARADASGAWQGPRLVFGAKPATVGPSWELSLGSASTQQGASRRRKT